jgi:hypothetical protein
VPYKSTCHHNLKKTAECDWIAKTCTEYGIEPGIEANSGVAHLPVDGVLDGGPRTTQPVLDDGQ